MKTTLFNPDLIYLLGMLLATGEAVLAAVIEFLIARDYLK